jgi:Mlc titration factor MtfA (ptsG expression regulator)
MSFFGRAVHRVAALFDELRGSEQTTIALREYRLLAVLVGVSGVVALSAVRDAPRGLGILGIILGLAYYLIASRRERRRQRLSTADFPDRWREILQRRVPLYSLLSPSERQRFDGEVQIFLGEQRIYALAGGADDGESPPTPLSDESKLLVAASAATLLLGRPEWRLPTSRDIVIYPTAFTEETYTVGQPTPRDPRDLHTQPVGQAIGMVHAQGPILLSLDALERSYPLSGRFAGAGSLIELEEPVLPHVGLHEFAHVLDFIGSQGRAAGVPQLLTESLAPRWHQQMEQERERLHSGQSVLSPYGLKNEAELFAVAVESFFQDPLRLRVYHPDLYALLATFFNQDPAARLVARHAAFVFRPWFALGPTSRYTA